MRVRKLSRLADEAEKLGMGNRSIIHTCSKCGWKTPIISNLSPNLTKEEPIWSDSIPVEYNESYCDKCNLESWRKIINET